MKDFYRTNRSFTAENIGRCYSASYKIYRKSNDNQRFGKFFYDRILNTDRNECVWNFMPLEMAIFVNKEETGFWK